MEKIDGARGENRKSGQRNGRLAIGITLSKITRFAMGEHVKDDVDTRNGLQPKGYLRCLKATAKTCGDLIKEMKEKKETGKMTLKSFDCTLKAPEERGQNCKCVIVATLGEVKDDPYNEIDPDDKKKVNTTYYKKGTEAYWTPESEKGPTPANIKGLEAKEHGWTVKAACVAFKSGTPEPNP